MHKNATKCNETLIKWCKNKHGASKIMDTLETYQFALMLFLFCGFARVVLYPDAAVGGGDGSDGLASTGLGRQWAMVIGAQPLPASSATSLRRTSPLWNRECGKQSYRGSSLATRSRIARDGSDGSHPTAE
jgi:hypothetical protein